jgi:kynurenine formamidase
MNDKNGVKHFPGLSAEACAYLARDRRVAAIGIDTPSIDYGPSTAFEAHHVSMALNVYHIENAARLTTLPATGFEVMVAPINIGGGSGGPARVFAFLK